VYLVGERSDKGTRKAVNAGSVKGIMKNNAAQFTDTTENVARFVAGAGDGLWNTKDQGQFERVKAGKKP
jgi:hypothetical protein